ncbi:WW domain [Phytophthora cactorum]|nr:WW domain [Phytophthora cactorum]
MDGEQEHDPATEEAGWEMRRDDTSGQLYYWNSVTGETSWKPRHISVPIMLCTHGLKYLMTTDTFTI